MTYDITIQQGATFELSLTWKENDAVVNVQGYSGHMQIRNRNTTGPIALDISTDNGGIVIHDDNTITLNATAVQTAAMKAVDSVYDLELSKDGKVYRILEGTVTISPEVTKDVV